MPNPQDVKRIAKATADFYNDHGGKDLESFVKEYWEPDIKMYNGIQREPYGVEQFLAMHSAEAGFSWDDTHMEVQKVVVGEDSFVIQMNITQWRTHEADAVEASGDDSKKAAIEGYQNDAIPAITFYTVGDGGKVVQTAGFVFLSPQLLAAGAGNI
jgi:hypothetical protein